MYIISKFINSFIIFLICLVFITFISGVCGYLTVALNYEESYSHILVLISCTLTILSVFPMVFIAINHYIDDTYQLINIAAWKLVYQHNCSPNRTVRWCKSQTLRKLKISAHNDNNCIWFYLYKNYCYWFCLYTFIFHAILRIPLYHFLVRMRSHHSF